MMVRTWLFLLLAVIPMQGAAQRTSVAFWNVENLYDTLPSLFYDDSDYTPNGKLHWSKDRYERKLTHLARVIDEMHADIVGLAEVESETVLRDLVVRLQTDYNYIHRTTSDRRGMDVALLYKGDKFFPERTELCDAEAGREFLRVTGELNGQPVDLIICHLPSLFNGQAYRMRAFESLGRLISTIVEDSGQVVVMGDMNTEIAYGVFRKTLGELEKQGIIRNLLADAARNGVGSYYYRGKWSMLDHILLSTGLPTGWQVENAGVFYRDYMLGTDRSSQESIGQRMPLRTFQGTQYIGGYSDHFPVFAVLRKRTTDVPFGN